MSLSKESLTIELKNLYVKYEESEEIRKQLKIDI